MCSCRRIPRFGTIANFHGSDRRGGTSLPFRDLAALPSDAHLLVDPMLTRFARMSYPGRFALLLPLLALLGCRRGERPVFELLSADRTGVSFANTITTSDSLNVQ